MREIVSGNRAIAVGAKLCKPGLICAYPITPQTEVVEALAEFIANGELKAEYIEIESEHSALSACIGAQATGVRTFTATSSQGLCVSPDSRLLLEDRIVTIGELVNENLKLNGKVSLDGGWEVSLSNGKTLVWNGRNFEFVNIKFVQRVAAPSKLIRVKTESGSEAMLTPEHQVLVDSSEGFRWKEAGKLKEGDHLIALRKLTIPKSREYYLLDILDPCTTARMPPRFLKRVKNVVVERFGSIKEGCRSLGIPYHHMVEGKLSIDACRRLSEAKILDFEEVKKLVNFFSLKGESILTSFSKLNGKLMYLLGLLHSGGVGGKKHLHRFVFTHSSNELFQLFGKVYRKLFPLGIALKRSAKKIVGSNFVLAEIFRYLKLERILYLREHLIAAFLRGYFDGNGECKICKEGINIWLFTRNREKVFLLKWLLLRLGIVGQVRWRKNEVKGICICNLQDALRFIEKIGSEDPEKKRIFEKFLDVLSMNIRAKLKGKAPLIRTKTLARDFLVRSKVLSHVCKARGKRAGKLKPNQIVANGERLVGANERSNWLKEFLNGSYFIDPVSDVEIVENNHEYVYDITVEKYRNFTPNLAFVVSNCLMHEMLFIASGLRLPILMAISNRALSSPLNIWGDQSDSLAQRDCGWLQFYCKNAQEALDTTIQAYRIAEDRRVLLPAMVCIDGFTLSHIFEPVSIPSQAKVDRFLPPYRPAYKLDPAKPITVGPVAFPDSYMEFKKQQADAMEVAKKVVIEVNEEFGKRFGRSYGNGLLETHGIEDADIALLGMGSVCGTALEVVKERGDVGLIRLKTFRPFPTEQLLKACEGLKALAVIDRAFSPGLGGPLYQEVKACLADLPKLPKISDFIMGLGGRDVRKEDIEFAVNNASKGKVYWVNVFGGKNL